MKGNILTVSSFSFCSVDPVKNGITNNNKDTTTVVVLDTNGVNGDSVFESPPCKRLRLMPPVNERLMLYVRQEQEDIFTPLHLVPPSTLGLLSAVSYNTLRKICRHKIVEMCNS